MTEVLLMISTVLSLLALGGLSFYASMKFFRIWRKYHEESIFHLGVLLFGLIFYLIFILLICVFSKDINLINTFLKRYLGIIYSFLALEMSLFYITTFINRRSLWEKYIPFFFGITFGLSFALLGIQETNPWFDILLQIIFLLPFIPITILFFRIIIRTRVILRNIKLSAENKSFLIALMFAAVFMYFGSTCDMIFFWVIIMTKINIYPIILYMTGFFTPIFFVISFILVRKIAHNMEEADVVHLMNLLS
jgi:hypothetical protein